MSESLIAALHQQIAALVVESILLQENYDELLGHNETLTFEVVDLKMRLAEVVKAWEALPGSRQQSVRDVERWLLNDMAPAINAIRATLTKEPGLCEDEAKRRVDELAREVTGLRNSYWNERKKNIHLEKISRSLRAAIRDAGVKRTPGLYEAVMEYDAALATLTKENSDV